MVDFPRIAAPRKTIVYASQVSDECPYKSSTLNEGRGEARAGRGHDKERDEGKNGDMSSFCS